ncbi:hypothetical protein [Amycolatopsis japonica]|uniref:hypothetical protein n=1 Tax=Amycolatopsis japonica TaxID=208439 RepID=UPI0037F6E274
MLAFDVGELSLETLSVFRACPCCGVVHSGQVGFQNGRTVRTKDPVAEEPSDGIQEFVFADADRGGQLGVRVGDAAVVLAGPAQVVRRPSLPGVADHAASAAVDDPASE